jgi:hypothetical protein
MRTNYAVHLADNLGPRHGSVSKPATSAYANFDNRNLIGKLVMRGKFRSKFHFVRKGLSRFAVRSSASIHMHVLVFSSATRLASRSQKTRLYLPKRRNNLATLGCFYLILRLFVFLSPLGFMFSITPERDWLRLHFCWVPCLQRRPADCSHRCHDARLFN